MSRKFRGTYAITGLGTAHLAVQVWNAKTRTWSPASPAILADFRHRAAGENRDYGFFESAFDIFGKYGNWHGSSRGGGRDDNKPGGIGNVNVKPKSAGDAVTQTHDIDSWLEANFEVGSVVYLGINGQWRQFTVKSFGEVQWDVVRDLAGVKTVESATALLVTLVNNRRSLFPLILH